MNHDSLQGKTKAPAINRPKWYEQMNAENPSGDRTIRDNPAMYVRSSPVAPKIQLTRDPKDLTAEEKMTEDASADARKTLEKIPSLLKLTDDFATKVATIADFDAMKKLVIQTGNDLWTTGKEAIKDPRYLNQDRPMYWARIYMRRAIRLNTFMQNNPDKIDEVINLLETHSRGFHEIGFSADSEEKPIKKIIISGFDPYGSHRTENNPSGAVAMTLDGETISDKEGNIVGQIEAVTFPVRYFDFDEGYDPNVEGGMVEDFMTQFLDPSNAASENIAAVITLSRTHTAKEHINVDRFAVKHRGSTYPDNLGQIFSDVGQISDSLGGDEILESTIPFDIILNPNLELEEKVKGIQQWNEVEEQMFKGLDKGSWKMDVPEIPTGADKTKSKGMDKFPPRLKQYLDYEDIHGTKHSHPENYIYQILSTLTPESEYKLPPFPDPKSVKKSIKGSGSNFLSNEIFYRVARLRENYRSAWEKKQAHPPYTGHLHLPLPSGGLAKISNITASVKEMIRKILIYAD